ncbi:DUF1036 domain-containing protein [Bacillus sp. GMa5/1]|uniref:DUF1036 domain-containing protein n=1 Tax=Bacillus sp. GMa5/1 TaxID=3418496 RepID=UPI003CF5F3B2
MGLSFHNQTNEKIYVAIAYSDVDCQSEGNIQWIKRGWWAITPNDTVLVWNGSANNKMFLYYAENDGPTRIWAGDRFTDLPRTAFSRCWAIPGGTDSRNLGLRLFTATADNFTMNLTP